MEDVTTSTAEQEQTSDGFMDGWNADEPLTEPEADQPAEAGESGADAPDAEETAAAEPPAEGQADSAEAETKPAQAEQAAEQPKTWNLNHLDETRTVNEAELVTLAQKGMDYDRIRGKYDEAKPVMELFGSFAKKAGMNVADYVAHIRTQAKQAGGLSAAEAQRAVELEDREAAVAAREAAEQERQAAQNRAQNVRRDADARRNADILEFKNTFPDAAKDPKSIPQEVWAEVNRGASLVSAYSKYAVAQAKAAQKTAEQRAEAMTQNQKNAGRATGSMKTAGDSAKGKDPFMDGFME